MPQQRVVVARRGAGREVLFCVCFANYIIRLGEVSCMFHGHVMLLVLITPLGWADRGKVLLSSKKGSSTHTLSSILFMGMKAFFVRYAALVKVADNRAGLVSTIGYSDLSLPPERDNRFPDFESLQQARLRKEHKERRRGRTGICILFMGMKASTQSSLFSVDFRT